MICRFFIILFLIAGSVSIAYCQTNDKNSLLDSSKYYYSSKRFFSVECLGKSKSSIAEDTNFSRMESFVDHQDKKELFKLSTGVLIYVYNNTEQYHINSTLDNFEKIKKRERKFTLYDEYKEYPFVDPFIFFNKMKESNFLFRISDSAYYLTGKEYEYEFDKIDFRVTKITKKVFDNRYGGNYYREIFFKYREFQYQDFKTQIEYVERIIGTSKNAITGTEERQNRPEYIDLSIFKSPKLIIKGNTMDVLNGKVLLLDFFYQGCLPCLKSHPILNDFYNMRNDRFTVIGIDHKVSDTLNMERYIKRHEVKYPVIVGETGKELSDLLKVNGWPTFVLIDSDGKILKYQTGLSNKFFRFLRNYFRGFN